MGLQTKTSRHFSTNSEGEYRLIYLFWEKQWQKAFFDKIPGKILCDAEKGDESAQREIWDFYARMAHTHACRFARCFCRDSGNIAQQYFSHNKKEPCDRVRIGCAFVLLIWLCLRQWSIDLGGTQTAQGMCEVQIVWIICTSAIPAGTASTKAISIYYSDSMLLVKHSLKIC